MAGCALALAGCSEDDDSQEPPPPPAPAKALVVGHRGASALRPEHTLESYRKAVEDGADIIEPDLVSTKDGVLVARHENEISGTTNVSEVAKFADRKATKTIDGVQLTGWFTEDFTLAELKELRARERIPQIRPANTQYNDQFEIPTLTEVIALAKQLSEQTGRIIPIYPETKHPTYFQTIGLPLEDRLVTALKADDYTASKATVYIQSFEVANLKALRARLGTSQSNWKLVQLLEVETLRPYDFTVAGDTRTYADLMTEQGMKEIATYANGVGPYKRSIINVDSEGKFMAPTALVRNAHAVNLTVHPYTFRPENSFMPAPLKVAGPDSTRTPAGLIAELHAYLDAGIDGFFTDDPAVGRQAVDSYVP
ncbi:glycerophosphodiester phosphodiesterase [Stigmatella aurantiaca]|uniref:glycerophosphodiester phosphodiesterase n=1 Tax=Stigmatella aurantiaca (strain DW4/3-1) TaxID=378806 RepID=E3FKF2_STIAD|nr:glycerophosphodiester phosphodiesterase [Stigmatella aurantiaca]ADO67925.1 Glycerophosphoryl diester phosphodiesterase [Stigmatella aurantiaca DW4/3-1]